MLFAVPACGEDVRRALWPGGGGGGGGDDHHDDQDDEPGPKYSHQSWLTMFTNKYIAELSD